LVSRAFPSPLIEPAASVPEVTVAAVAARDQARADAFALRHGIPAAYGSYEELLADPDIDVIYNPPPNPTWTCDDLAAPSSGQPFIVYYAGRNGKPSLG
jgi:hypothetical protein